MWNTLKRIGELLDEILNPITMDQLTLNALADIETLRAQLAQAEIELADKAFYQREFAAVSAERNALRERVSVPGVDPPAGQVEALARVLQSAYSRHIGYWADWDTWTDYRQDGFRAEARAAIAHLAKRPEELPTAEEIKYLPGKPHVFNNELLIAAYKALKTRHALEWDDETNKDGWQRVVDVVRTATYETLAPYLRVPLVEPKGLPDEHVLAAIMCEANGSTVSVLTGDDGYSIVARAALTALRPWLRDPVGWELDVTAAEIMHACTTNMNGYEVVLDLCRSRIRPVYECKECAKVKGASMAYIENIESSCRSARAALEGE